MPAQSSPGRPTHLSIHRLRDDLPRFVPEASRLRTRDGRGRVSIAKQRQHVGVQVPLDARHSSTCGSPVRVDKRLQPERRPKRRVPADQAPAKDPGRFIQGFGAGCRRRPGRGGTNSCSSSTDARSSSNSTDASLNCRGQEGGLEELSYLLTWCCCFRLVLLIQHIAKASVCITVGCGVWCPIRLAFCGRRRHDEEEESCASSKYVYNKAIKQGFSNIYGGVTVLSVPKI